MEILIPLLVLLTFVTIIGHLIWVMVRAILRWLFLPDVKIENESPIPSDPVTYKLDDLTTTERQIVRFYRDGRLNDETYDAIMKQLRAERTSLVTPHAVVPKKEFVPPPEPVETKPGLRSGLLPAERSEVAMNFVIEGVVHHPSVSKGPISMVLAASGTASSGHVMTRGAPTLREDLIRFGR